MFVRDKERRDITIGFRVTKSQKEVVDFLCEKTSEKPTDLLLRLLQQEADKYSDEIIKGDV
jgi:hypothetical protein